MKVYFVIFVSVLVHIVCPFKRRVSLKCTENEIYVLRIRKKTPQSKYTNLIILAVRVFLGLTMIGTFCIARKENGARTLGIHPSRLLFKNSILCKPSFYIIHGPN